MKDQIKVSDPDGGLLSVLDLCNVHMRIVQKLTNAGVDGEGLKTLREFVAIWRRSKYESQIKRWIKKNVAEFKDKLVEIGRLRLAWKAAHDLIQSTEKVETRSAEWKDWEDPLPSGEKEKMEEDFNNTYHVVFDNYLYPGDPLVNRIWREFHCWAMTVTQISQMKSISMEHIPPTKEESNLTDKTKVTTEVEFSFVPKTVVEYYWGLRILMNAWGKCGNYLVDSQLYPGSKVLMMPLDKAVNYADQGLRIVTSSGLPFKDQLGWWERKDRITRGAMAGYVRQKWPAQEALQKALHDTNTDWTVIVGNEVQGVNNIAEGLNPGIDLSNDRSKRPPAVFPGALPQDQRQRMNFQPPTQFNQQGYAPP